MLKKFVNEEILQQRLTEGELCPPDLLKGQEESFARDIEKLKSRYSQFVEVCCPACGGSDDTFTFKKHTFTYMTCKQCQTLYMNPRPSPEIMQEYYTNSENYQYWAKYIFPASEDSRREKLHQPWLERVIDYCDRYCVEKGTLVEVGAGFGTFSLIASESGAFEKVIAIDRNPQMAASCRYKGVQVINKSIEEVEDEVVEADVVVAFELIEHTFDPGVFLTKCNQLLKPTGLLVLSCPNGQGFDITLLKEKSLAIDPEHVNFLNPASLTLLLHRSGFRVLQINTPGRLDAEFVHEAIKKGEYDVSKNPFFQKVFVEEWDRLGWPFQQFLAKNSLSSHMWAVAVKDTKK